MKKVISILLSVILVFSVASSAFAAEAQAPEYSGNPVIIVRGIDFAGLTYEDGTKALQFSADKLLPLLAKSFFARFGWEDTDSLMDSLMDVAYGILSPIACDKEGNSVEPVSMVQYKGSMANHLDVLSTFGDGGEEGIVKTAVEKYGAENTYFFTYDWRKTPEKIAEELNEYVETALADSGREKVNIICVSMGGMVMTSYFHYFGTENVETAVYLSGAQNGTYVCGDALNGRIVFDKKTLFNLAYTATDDNLFLKIFLTLFNALGAVDFLVDFANDLVANSFDKANDAVLRDCFGTLCGFWSLCPDADFDSGVQTIFGGYEEEYPVLLEKINEVRSFVFSTEETLLKAKEDGVKLSFVSNYNIGLVPVYERAYKNGDMVLESELTSNNATFAPLKETLSDEYIAAADAKYISPDRVIDASTALFKNNTWFVKNAPHVAANYGSGFSDFVFTLLESEAQPDITSFESYPQFMIADDALNITKLVG